MIVSHRHKFIFLKTRKTAGTSVELALSQLCGPEDIVTPQREEHLRIGDGPRNYCVLSRNASLASRLRVALGVPKSRDWAFYDHLSAARARQELGDEIWRTYRKVTIVRNPFDQLVSLYHWRVRNNPNPPSFRDAAPGLIARGANYTIYAIDGIPAADTFLRYETLATDFRSFLRGLGVEDGPVLLAAKAGIRPVTPWRDYYDEETRRLVADANRQEIDLFGYDFGD